MHNSLFTRSLLCVLKSDLASYAIWYHFLSFTNCPSTTTMDRVLGAILSTLG